MHQSSGTETRNNVRYKSKIDFKNKDCEMETNDSQ